MNFPQHKALFILIRCTEGRREREVAKKLSEIRKTEAFPRHRLIFIFLHQRKGESLKRPQKGKVYEEKKQFVSSEPKSENSQLSMCFYK